MRMADICALAAMCLLGALPCAAVLDACGDREVAILARSLVAPAPDGALPQKPIAVGADTGLPNSADTGLSGSTSPAFRYEAESRQNVLIQNAIVDSTCFGANQTCPPDGVIEGANCCSGGAAVFEILGRVPCSGAPGTANDKVNCQLSGGGVEFHGVTVPGDGTYDVTWWYHCGGSNGYGDVACGGVHYSVGSSCRPHLIDVNGVPMASTEDGQVALIYQFPCYPGAWSVLHGATTALPLRAGPNVVFIHAPHALTLDSADIDALDVLPRGQGAPPLVTPVASGY